MATVDRNFYLRYNYLVNLNDFEGTGNYSFNGITITDIEPLFEDGSNNSSQLPFYSYLVSIPSNSDIDIAISALKERENIVFACKNYTLEIEQPNNEPMLIDDTSEEPYQWSLDEDPLNLAAVREKSFTGSSDIVVAVFDGGFATHPDLTNVDMSRYYNAVLNNTDMSNASDAYKRHGNMVAGIIGANNDGVGIDGICKNVTILPIKILDEIVVGRGENICVLEAESYIRAIDYACRQNNAKIINVSCSMNFNCPDHAQEEVTDLLDLIDFYGVLFVTSAGNQYSDLEYAINSVKPNDRDNWIVVGSSNSNNEKSDFSNHSEIYVDMFAPGEAIYSTGLTGYYSDNGTSFASPHIAAACALIMSKATHLSPVEVKQLLMDTVTQVEGFAEYCVSGGILSINNAIDALYEEIRPAYSKGDIDGDGEVDTMDYTLCRRIVMETMVPSESQVFAADIDGDDIVETEDYVLIERFNERTYYFARTALEVQ